MSRWFLLAALSACVVTVSGAVTALHAQQPASISINAPGSVSPRQHISVAGQLRVNGQPAPANTPVVLFFRPQGGPDAVVATGVTNANGNYRLLADVPARPGNTLQIRVVSGGAPQNVASNAVIVPVR